MSDTAPKLFDSMDRDSPSFAVTQDDEVARANPIIKQVYNYWLSIGGGVVPYRSAFDFMDIYQAAPNLILLHRYADRSFRYVYFGTALVDLFGYDFTGDEITPERRGPTGRIDWEKIYSEILDTGAVILEKRDIEDFPNKEMFTAVSFKAPLADDDGNPAFLLNCLVPLDRLQQSLF